MSVPARVALFWEVAVDPRSGSFADDVAGWFEPDEVHQASGMVSAQLGVPIAVAVARLRAYAAAVDRAVVEVACEVVTGRLRLSVLPAQRVHRAMPAGPRR